METCKICDKECRNFKALATHIQFKHDKKHYYDTYMKKEGDGLCKVCGNETKFTILNRGYEKFCSKKCDNADRPYRLDNADLEIRRLGGIKRRKTNLEKYGVEINTQRSDIKEQVKQKNLKKYGVENVIQVDAIKEKALLKREKTCMTNHGVKSYFGVKEIQEKIKLINLKKYGFSYPMQNINVYEKVFKKGIHINYFNSTIYYRGSYELDFLNNYFNTYNIIQGLSFKYIINNKNKMYFSDFYIPSLNLIIEIKNSYLAKRDDIIIEAKKQSVLDNGYNYIMIVNKDYTEFNSLFPIMFK